MTDVPRKAVYISLGYLFGSFASFYLGVKGSLCLLIASALLFLLALLLRSSLREKAMLTALACVIAVTVSVIYQLERVAPIEKLDGETVFCEGRVIEAGESDSEIITVSGKINSIPCKYSVSVSNFGGSVGDQISFVGVAQSLENTLFFDSKTYYYTDGILAYVRVTDKLEIESRNSLRALLGEFSRFCSDRIRSTVSGDAGDILCAMTLGDTSLISDEARLYMNRVGIGHIVSVSGLHVSAAAAAVMLILKKLRAPKALYLLSAEAVVIIYTLFTGFRISCVRAAIMFSIFAISRLLNRPGDSLNTVSVAALAIALSHPFASADVSLLLSLGGVFAVSVVAPFAVQAFGIRSKLLGALTASACASLVTFPAITLFFSEVSLISPIANFLLVPLATLPIYLTMAFCALGCPAWAEILIKLSGIIVDLILTLSKEISRFEFTYAPTRAFSPFLAISLGITLMIAVFLIKGKKPALLAAVGACAILCSAQIFSTVPSNEIYLDLLVSNGDISAVLRKDRECIIIDMSSRNSGKHSSAQLENLQSLGVNKTLAVSVCNENPESAYSSYLKFSPDVILLPEDSYVFSGEQNVKTIPETIECFGIEIKICDGLILVSDGERTFAISNSGYFKECDCGLYAVDNLVIYKDENNTIIYDGDTELSFRLV